MCTKCIKQSRRCVQNVSGRAENVYKMHQVEQMCKKRIRQSRCVQNTSGRTEDTQKMHQAQQMCTKSLLEYLMQETSLKSLGTETGDFKKNIKNAVR